VSRAAYLQVSFADFELIQQGLVLEPLLGAISDFLDDHEEMIAAVCDDLRQGLKNPDTGRHGLTPQQILRSLVLMRVKNWDYRELRERIADGLTLRQFANFYCSPVPKHDAFHTAFIKLSPQTLKAVNDLLIKAAVDLGVEDSTKLRVDTTVVQTDIHHPTDNTLLWDVVRVITRLIGRLAAALERRRIKGFRDRTRSARRRMQEIQRMTARQRQDHQAGTYRELIGIAEEVVESAGTALRQTRKAHGRDMIAELAIAETRREIERFCDLGARVIDQSRRRVLNGEQVPTAEKIYSIFEPHTDLIKRGKVQTPIEFGHKVFLAESARGLITQYEVLDGNPVDEQHVVVSLERHRQSFGEVPKLYGSDRGFFSEANVRSCQQEGVKVVCIPQRGGTKTSERQAYGEEPGLQRRPALSRRHRRAHLGVVRGRGMKRCLAEGRERFELFVAAAVLANNLMKIAALLTQRSSRRRKAA
jgi:IS5 family transposase